MDQTEEDTSIKNVLTVRGAHSERCRFQKLILVKGRCRLNFGNFAPVPVVISSLPLNHTQQKVYGETEFKRDVWGFAENKLTQYQCTSEFLRYWILTWRGEMIQMTHRMSRLFRYLTFEVSTIHTSSTESFVARNGRIRPVEGWDSFMDG